MTRNSVIHDFLAHSSESRHSMGILFSFYVILGLHHTSRNVNLRISEKALYFEFNLWQKIHHHHNMSKFQTTSMSYKSLP